jgi:uncharacterized tellurite resistance protein B-like protein
MKKILVFVLLVAFCSTITLPQEAKADDSNDGWGIALIAAGIIGAAILIVLVVTKDNAQKAENLNKIGKIAENSIFAPDTYIDKFSSYADDNHKRAILFYSFKVEF